MPKKFFITTAIDYTNSPPHVGHAYEKVLADVIARYHRLNGEKVFFLTGVDQHGQKVQQSAKKAGIAPAEFVKGITQEFVDLWKKLDVKYDAWAATTDPLHKNCVREILQRLFDQGQIYKDKQSGYYSVRQEQFLTDKERGTDGEFGPEWGEIEFREEENYYFKLGQHKEWLLRYIDNRKDAVIPDFRQTELRNAVERISGDLCISRPKSRLDWGIELPFDKDFVTYVWFDALTNYITFAGYEPDDDFIKEASFETKTNFKTYHPKLEGSSPNFRDLWPALHVIGKDILVPAHGIYWLCILHALGFGDVEMPTLLVHGWWNFSGTKMSKSIGNIVDPQSSRRQLKPRLRQGLDRFNIEQVKKNEPPLSRNKITSIVERCGSEALRNYLMRDISTGQDADFSELRLIERYNSDLANNIGNLLSRTLSMAQQYREGRLLANFDDVAFEEHRFRLTRQIAEQGYPFAMGQFNVDSALGLISMAGQSCNALIDDHAPWKLAKDPMRANHLDSVLYHLAESLRIIAILISPVLPGAAHRISDQLNWRVSFKGKEKRFRLEDTKWGGLPDGHVVGKPVPLFPRIDA